MSLSRRRFLRRALAGAGAASASAATLAAVQHVHPAPQVPSVPAPAAPDPHAGHHMPAATEVPEAVAPERWSRAPMLPPPGPTPPRVETPDIPHLTAQMEDGVKVFHLRAEPVKTDFVPGRPVDAWGFNGSIPGPTIEVTQGDRVRIVVENRLPELFAMHWHGLEVPPVIDGVPGLGAEALKPGEQRAFEFTMHQEGTFFYHSHFPMQELMGLIGLLISHPARAHEPRVHRDVGMILQGWAILPNNTVPNTLAMEFNWLTINGKAGPATTPVIARLGERIRLRFVNLSMDHHPIHLHGHTFHVTGTEGGRIPRSAWIPGNTVIVGVAQAREIEFDAVYPGDWMVHCHLPHHMMNQMVSMVGPLSVSRPGMPTGIGMDEGMGILTQGHALADHLGPSMGRTLGAGNAEQAVTNAPLDQGLHVDHAAHALHADHAAQAAQPAVDHSAHAAHGATAAPDAWAVKGYPQDMWMVADDLYASKPECDGLPPGWTGSMMGMMTLIRVLPPADYDRIMARKAAQAGGTR